MSEAKLKARIKRVLLSIYGTAHACALRRGERGLRKGRLCDDCLEMVELHLKDIFDEASK